MIPFGLGALLGATAAAGSLPFVIDRLRQRPQDLHEQPNTDFGMSDYLPYEELLPPETIVTTYGGLGAMYEVEFNDPTTMSDTDRVRHCAWLNDAQMKIARLTTKEHRWMMQTYLIPSAALPLEMPEQFFSDGQRVLAEARATHLDGKRCIMRNLLAFCYLPPATSRESLFIERASPVDVSFDRVYAEFLKGLHGIEDSLRQISKPRRLGRLARDPRRSELLEAIFEVLYDEPQPIVVGDTAEPQAIGGLLAARDVIGGMAPQVGRKHVRVLSIYGVPSNTTPVMLDAFVRAAVPGCRFATRAIYQDPTVASKRLKTMRDRWAGNKTSVIAKANLGKGAPRVDRHAASQEERVEKEIEVVATNRIAYAHFNAKALVFSDDLESLPEKVRAIRRALQSEGFTVNEETVNSLEAYFGHVPFEGHRDVREGQVHSANIARIWSAQSAWRGRWTWNCKNCGPKKTVPALVGLTRTNEDFAIDPHDEDSQSFLVLGAPGTGKTFILNSMAGGYVREKRDFIGTIDKNYGQFVTNQFLAGKHYDRQRYWLFANLENPDKRRYLAKFIPSLAQMNGAIVERHAIFADALDLMLSDPIEQRTFSSFIGLLSPMDRSPGKIVTTKIADYAMGGIYDGAFDGLPERDQQHYRHETHELGAILKGNTNDKIAAPVLLWVLQSFEGRMPGCRSIVLIDEAWAPIKPPEVANEVEEFLRTTRFRHSGVGFFTHSIDEVKKNPIGKTVVSACKTRILLPNPDASSFVDANEPEANFYVNALKLTPAQIEIVRMGTPKKDGNLVCGEQFGPFSLNPSPAEAAVYGCTGAEEVAAARLLMEDHPDSWRERHMLAYGCTREAERLRSLRLNKRVITEQLLEAITA